MKWVLIVMVFTAGNPQGVGEIKTIEFAEELSCHKAKNFLELTDIRQSKNRQVWAECFPK